ncbi:MAG TPA: peptidase S53 [Janthinobacterium sp.]|nr:peptidase S53 [Janthinobacterium sp.]
MNPTPGALLLRTVVLGISLAIGAVSEAAAIAPAPPAPLSVQANEPVRFQVVLPLQNKAQLEQLLLEQRDPASPNYQRWLTPRQFKSRFGAHPDSIARVRLFLQARGLSVVGENAQGVSVRGSALAAAAALGMVLEARNVQGARRLVASHLRGLRAELKNEGAMIAAFAPVAGHRLHSARRALLPANRYSADGSYWFTDIKQAYDFPAYPTLTGAGATVAIVMSSDFSDADLAAYFAHEHWNAPLPTTIHVPLLGAGPFNPANDAAFEANLDVQQVSGMAPGATVRLYNIPDLSDDAILFAYQSVVDENIADVVSSSFGGPEDAYAAAYNDGVDFTYILTALEQVFMQGNAQGITFVASSGDSGGLAMPSLGYFTGAGSATFLPGVEHPACSPSVTGVGGTNLQTVTGQGNDSAYVSENAFGDPELPYDPYGLGIDVSGGYWGSGGGVSRVFAKPDYQKLVATGSTTMRTVPDLALMEGGCPSGLAVLPCAAHRSSAAVAFGGYFYGAIGTSVAAPEFAGALALAVQNAHHRLGNVNPMLYQKALAQAHHVGLPVFHTNIQGFNGYEYTAPVYNQVVGLGTPYIRQLIGAAGAAPAGIPWSASNP